MPDLNLLECMFIPRQLNIKVMALILHMVSVLIKVFNLTLHKTAVEVAFDWQRADLFSDHLTSFNSWYPVDLGFLSFLLDLSNELL